MLVILRWKSARPKAIPEDKQVRWEVPDAAIVIEVDQTSE